MTSRTFDRWLTSEPEPDEETCGDCGGTGWGPDGMVVVEPNCPTCHGTGTVPRSDEHPDPDAAYERAGDR